MIRGLGLSFSFLVVVFYVFEFLICGCFFEFSFVGGFCRRVRASERGFFSGVFFVEAGYGVSFRFIFGFLSSFGGCFVFLRRCRGIFGIFFRVGLFFLCS